MRGGKGKGWRSLSTGSGDRLMLSPLQGRDTKACRLVRLAAVERGLNVPPPLPTLSPEGERAFGPTPTSRLPPSAALSLSSDELRVGQACGSSFKVRGSP